MKFFVPLARTGDEAEYLWAGVRAVLEATGLPTTRRRIHALSLSPDCERMVEVGLDLPDDDGPVLAIFEAAGIDLFYVCTPERGIEGPPWALGLSGQGEAIDFDEAPAGHC